MRKLFFGALSNILDLKP